jgi:hypothetical protein
MNSSTIIVADVKNSALSISALSRSSIEDAAVIHAIDFLTPRSLLNELIERKPQVILFSWRQALIDILNFCSPKELESLRKQTILAVLIPDHIGISTKSRSEESNLLNYVDYYMVTSEILFEFYSKLPDSPKPIAVLHDLPDINLIRHVRGEKKERKFLQATWVGNSKWGINHGFIDHKGFTSVIQPLIEKFESHAGCTKVKVFDSAVGRTPNIEVLRTIRNSNFLLQCSLSEGTGLPILEALGLGVTPITTDVGVAREVLRYHSNLIVTRNPDSFHALIHEEMLNPTLSEEVAIKIFEDFVNAISREQIPRNFQKTQNMYRWPQARFKSKIRLLAIWALRYFRNLT